MIGRAKAKSSGPLLSNRRIYAIGDIHGMLDPLRKMHELIEKDQKKYKGESLLVYLGDYIDRGPKSKEVVDTLIAQQLKSQCVFLKGNHEHAMLGFLNDPQKFAAWLEWGGLQTIASYGVDAFTAMTMPNAFTYLARRLSGVMPVEHKNFYESLKLVHEEEHFIFVHAGLRPGVAIADQNEQDILMIRDDFINADCKFEKRVVFGHTIFEAPFQKPDRLGIDTGAYMSGKLTCAVLDGAQVRFIST